MTNLTDFLIALDVDANRRAARNTARIAERVTWTEEMKQAYWDEQARLAIERERILASL